MSKAERWTGTRATSMAVTVTYNHDHDKWVGQYSITFRSSEDPDMQLGSASIEFGPFDSYIEVGYWLSGLSKVLRTMQAEPLRLSPPDPTPGNDSAPATRPGR